MSSPYKDFIALTILLFFMLSPAYGQESSKQAATQKSMVQAISLSGEKFYARGESDSTLMAVVAELQRDPDNVEILYRKGRALANLWRYREAFEVYQKCSEIEPLNPIFYRRRGHRYITFRQFDKAVAELKKAAKLNRNNPFVDSSFTEKWGRVAERLEFEIRYHLGLAYFLQGQFEKAKKEYELAYEASIADESRVSASYWLCMTLQRLRDRDSHEKALARIRPEMDPGANSTYFDLLMLFKGAKSEHEVMPKDFSKRFETMTFGVGNFRKFKGDDAGALDIFKKTASDDHWPGFGLIAAEVDLLREKERKSW